MQQNHILANTYFCRMHRRLFLSQIAFSIKEEFFMNEGGSGVILETEGSVRKYKRGHFSLQKS